MRLAAIRIACCTPENTVGAKKNPFSGTGHGLVHRAAPSASHELTWIEPYSRSSTSSHWSTCQSL